MKTNLITRSSAVASAPGFAVSRLRSGVFSHLLTALAFGMILSFTAAPRLEAAAPNGYYKFVKASGQFTVAGETMVLDEDTIKQFAALQNGKLTISNNRLQLNRSAASRIITQLGNQFGLKFNTTITGPTYVQLRKSGTSFVGATATPVVVKFSTTYEGQKISGSIRTHFKVKVTGRDLYLTVPVTGSALGYNLKGQLKVTCRR